MAQIPAEYRDLLERPVLAILGTAMPSGDIQLHPVWVDELDGRLRVNTARGRQKDRNLARTGRATLLLVDPDNPYRYLEVRGRVVDALEAGARQHIDQLTQKYVGEESFPVRPGQVRVTYIIEPTRVVGHGKADSGPWERSSALPTTR